MDNITIPYKIALQGDLVVIPRKKYEELMVLQQFKEFKPTIAQKKALLRAERNLSQKKTLSYNELIKKLGFTD